MNRLPPPPVKVPPGVQRDLRQRLRRAMHILRNEPMPGPAPFTYARLDAETREWELNWLVARSAKWVEDTLGRSLTLNECRMLLHQARHNAPSNYSAYWEREVFQRIIAERRR